VGIDVSSDERKGVTLPEYVSADDDLELDDELSDFVKRSGVNQSPRSYEAVSALSALTQQMSFYPTLKPAEQRERLVTYREGMEAQALLDSSKKLKPGSSKYEAALSKTRQGDRAQTELLGAMFRLVHLIARELSTRRYGREKGLSMLEDLVAEANLELVEALHRVNVDKIGSFSAYAGRIARDRIRSSLNNDAHVQVPGAWLRLNSIAATRIPELINELGRRPSIDEIKDALRVRCYAWAWDHLSAEQQKLPEEQCQALMRAKLVKQGMLGAIDRYEEVVALTQTTMSMDAPVGEDGGSSFGDVMSLADGRGDSVYEEVEAAELAKEIQVVLASFSDRERDIILKRFGWLDGEVWTYAKIAPLYGVSAERVRQIEASVLGKLRGPDFAQLSDYLPG